MKATSIRCQGNVSCSAAFHANLKPVALNLMPVTDLRALAGEDFCYLTTTGRVTGRPHEIEIWFALVPERRALYMLSGGGDRSDWVKNLRRNPEVTVRVADGRFAGLAREARDAEEDELARRLLVEKYESSPGRLETWRRIALPVVVDLAN